jgi:hypothetical protein
MPRIRLPVIEEPEEGTRTVFTRGPEVPADNREPFVKGEGEGEGDTDLVCGQCQLLLVQRIRPGQLINIVLHCPRCGAYNNVA